MHKIVRSSQNGKGIFSSLLGPLPPLPAGRHLTQTAFCHRRLESVTPAGCATCFAADERAQVLYGCRRNCDAANTSPTSPSLGSEFGLLRAAHETVGRAIVLDTFHPIGEFVRKYPYMGPLVVKVLARAGRREWLREFVRQCQREIGL